MKALAVPLICLPLVALEPCASAKAEGGSAADLGQLGEVVVTATKQSQSITKVPMSIAAYSKETLDREGTKNIDDLVNLTPGVALSKTLGSGAGNNISIRGISSSAGAPTTAIYIDDTPVQVRLLNLSSNTERGHGI